MPIENGPLSLLPKRVACLVCGKTSETTTGWFLRKEEHGRGNLVEFIYCPSCAAKVQQEIEEQSRNANLGRGGRGHYEAEVAVIYAEMQKTGEALEILEDLKQRRAKGGDVPAIFFAWVYAALGNKDEAFEWLDTAYKEDRRSLISPLKSDYDFDPLRSDPRFQDLLRRMICPE